MLVFFMDHNSKALAALIAKARISQKEAAERLSKAAGQAIPERTLRSWLNDRKAPSSRKCPGWAVTIAKTALKPFKSASVSA